MRGWLWFGHRSPSVCLACINSEFEPQHKGSDVVINKYPMSLENPRRSFNETSCCSKSISRFLKGSSNHLDDKKHSVPRTV